MRADLGSETAQNAIPKLQGGLVQFSRSMEDFERLRRIPIESVRRGAGVEHAVRGLSMTKVGAARRPLYTELSRTRGAHDSVGNRRSAERFALRIPRGSAHILDAPPRARGARSATPSFEIHRSRKFELSHVHHRKFERCLSAARRVRKSGLVERPPAAAPSAARARRGGRRARSRDARSARGCCPPRAAPASPRRGMRSRSRARSRRSRRRSPANSEASKRAPSRLGLAREVRDVLDDARAQPRDAIALAPRETDPRAAARARRDTSALRVRGSSSRMRKRQTPSSTMS